MARYRRGFACFQLLSNCSKATPGLTKLISCCSKESWRPPGLSPSFGRLYIVMARSLLGGSKPRGTKRGYSLGSLPGNRLGDSSDSRRTKSECLEIHYGFTAG